jgi:hypothetical protein
MSESANVKPSKNTTLMSTGFIIGLILIGIFSFSALIGLSGYADDIRDKNNGQAHVLSNSAIGYSGLKSLLDDLGFYVTQDPNEAPYFISDTLRIYTLNSTFQTDVLDELNPQAPKLIILPKWNVTPIEGTAGWVRKSPYSEVQGASLLASNLEALVEGIKLQQADGKDETNAKEYQFELIDTGSLYSRRMPRLQTISGDNFIPVIQTEDNKTVLAKVKNTQTYILSDPDFMNTAGLNTRSGAKFAIDIFTYLEASTETYEIIFDLNIHGIGGRQNMVKLFTQPPFLSITVLLLSLIALMGWQAFLRFGDPIKGNAEDFGEDLHMGPQSLTRTTAEFLAIAGREPKVMADYAKLIRDQAHQELQLPGRDPKARNYALDKRESNKGIEPAFESLKTQAEAVTQKHEMIRVAKALQDWKKDITA